MPLKNSTHKAFTNTPENWWDPDGPFWTLHAINPLRLSFILQYIQTGNALDIGCGGGILSESLSSYFTTTGIDIDKNLIAIAKSRRSSVNYLHTNTQDFAKTHKSSFDLITCLEVLEHIKNPKDLLNLISTMIKPGGYLILSTINRNLLAFLGAIVSAEHILKIVPKNTHDYADFIRPDELTMWAHQCGLTLIDIQGILYHPISRQFSIGNSTQINYIACFKRL